MSFLILSKRRRHYLPFSSPWPADGAALGGGWLALGSWAVSGGRAVCTPTPGIELVTNGLFASDITGWSNFPGVTFSTLEWAAGALHAVKATDALAIGGSDDNIAQTAGVWYRAERSVTVSSGATPATQLRDAVAGTGRQLITTPVQTYRAGTTENVVFEFRTTLATDFLLDNVSIKALSPPSLIAVRQTGTPNQDISVPVTLTAGLQGGVWMRCDKDPRVETPLNGIKAYHDGTNLNMVKCVNGVYTSLIAAAAAYAANRVVRGVAYGNTARAFYNGVQIGTDQSVSDVPPGTYCGLFATNEGVSFGTPTIVRATA